jgi:hypothetical protein
MGWICVSDLMKENKQLEKSENLLLFAAPPRRQSSLPEEKVHMKKGTNFVEKN